MKYPKIYLVLDNCFAIKRWVKPSEWLELIKYIGFNYVQASNDNEIDPLFSPVDYMDDWFEEVKHYEKLTGLKVINFYTGYQTYRTIGLAHHDERVRRKLMDQWLKPIIKRLSDLGARGIGFSYFAMPDEVMQDPVKFKERMKITIDLLGELSQYAYENGRAQVSVEQMYAPWQPPFTIEGTRQYLKDVYKVHNKPFYTTIDVGHMVGQKKFLKPTELDIQNSLINAGKSQINPSIFLGSDSAYEKWDAANKSCNTKGQLAVAVKEISAEINKYPYFFTQEKDANAYRWLEELACYSPIIHMQQTDGVHSSHAAFTPEANKNGIITGEKLLAAIAKSYRKQAENGLPAPVDDIYLSFEIFSSNTETKREIITKLVQTLVYWRKYVPEDGLMLDKLL